MAQGTLIANPPTVGIQRNADSLQPVAARRPATQPNVPKLTEAEWVKGFAAGVGSGLYVQIIGYLSFLEIFLLVTLPLSIGRYVKAAVMPGARTFFCLWLLWIFGQVVSDVANDNDFGFAARGLAKAFFSGFVTLALLPSMLQRPRLFESFLAGLPLAHLIGAKFFRSGAYTRQDGRGWMTGEDLGWESWGGYFFTLSLAYIVARFWRSRPWLCTLATLAMGAVHVAMGSRSTGLYHILAACLMPLVIDVTRTTDKSSVKRTRWKRSLPWGRFVAAFAVIIVATVIVKDSYEYYASTGVLGEKALRKFERQAKYGNLIMGARQGPFIGIAAAIDKPIIGHGAWARMEKDYLAAASDLFGVEFYREKGFNYHRVFIPSHSMIIAAWVEGGIFGLVFWVFALLFVAVNLPRAVLILPDYAGVILINSMGFFWSVLFSPIQSRNYTAMIFVPLLVASVVMRAQKRASPIPAVKRPTLLPQTAIV
jgi:O-antigen ligase